MQTQHISFEHLTAANSGHLVRKDVLKQRIKNTQLDTAATSFSVAEWTTEDNVAAIAWSFSYTIFGEALLASTSKGVCFIGFTNDDRANTLAGFQRRFPDNPMVEASSPLQEDALRLMNDPALRLLLHLHLKGTAFQLEIWHKLLRIPFGGLTTYMALTGNRQDARAIGSAVGANPVAYLVPCHRVIRTDGSFHGYHWGTALKRKLLVYEVPDTQPVLF
ncbi:methylated-DNA--[protein]-cysteine S-methyltransferase [Chitinophaga agrisoli]|uniref:Methylated-DNA--[protein]-cysteine S-methyltransferase n=1 Tax=Chitinophaga agrisoli TaxID=2607653 RepID=A0A5B2VUP0_9BACT|nr:methylated-DNA--[protein]-cysteine S-methyltransferase [Chitinophaga agrisoli]KAA2242961.1 methylated-DNA--[protein]-cysteine S-methyltransferase [Chitinophaga agrisoli]